MPGHRDVSSLRQLSLRAVGKLITCYATFILRDIKTHHEPQRIVRALQQRIEFLRALLESHCPRQLYTQLAFEVLSAVKELIDRTKKSYSPNVSISAFLTEMNVVVSLTEVVLGPELCQIDFQKWPRIMRYVLYKNMHRMTGLEKLNLGSCSGGWKENDRCLADGMTKMRNLRSLCLCFDATDQIVQMLAKSCPVLAFLDLTSSGSVTDRSVPHLLRLRELQEVQLHRTSVSATALAALVTGLTRLQSLGRCDDFASVVRHLHPTGCFPLRRVHTRDLSTDVLRLLVDIFPEIEYICLFLDEHSCDLTVLISLDRLRELKLLSCAFYGDYLKQLLEVRGRNITSLHLEHVEELDFRVLKDISQCCPYVKNLVFYNCDFSQSSSALTDVSFKTPPFFCLERLFWVVDGVITHLEFILAHAFGIQYIHLGSSTGITHSSVVNILSKNPMRQLEEFRVLYSIDMSMRTVELLMASCINLKVLSELESWQGITLNELNAFKNYIVTNNFDLDISPTLSFTT
nr:unnamed protein product [Callosobruchus analis]